MVFAKDSQLILYVVADFVGDHVGHGEVPASLVFGCQFLVEAHIQINLFVGRTVEGTSRCLPNPTACLCPSGIED